MTDLSRLVVTMALVISAGATQAAAPVAEDWEQAIAQAKRDRRDLVVVLTGSDWDRGSVAVAALARDAAFLRACDDAIVVPIDHPDYPDAAQKRRQERNKGFRLHVYRYPALLYLDAQQRPVGIWEGATGDVTTATARVADWRGRRQRRDDLLAQAERATGARQAELLGQALDVLDDAVARHHYRAVLDRIGAADPDDRSGYLGKFRFDANALVEREIWPRLKDRRYEAALAFLDKRLANRRLLTGQRQELLAMRHAVYRAWPDHAAEARQALEEAIALDPKSDVALGARKRLADIEQRELVATLREGVKKAQAGQNPNVISLAQDRYLRVAHLDPTLGRLPKFPAPAGWLVSAEGRCTFSSISRPYGEPWRHFLITRDVAPGAFHTERERRPWVQVELPRSRSLTAVVVVNRDGNSSRQVPLRMQLSADGKTWQDVYRSDRDQRFWRVEFVEKRPQARFVRVGRDDDREEYFHLANVLIYGE